MLYKRSKMPNAALIDATDLTHWADRRDAQGRLPQLVRRLILATTGKVTRIGFRSQEGVQFAGWDGTVAADSGNPFVPSGLSVWELGTNRNITEKANEDYDSRVADPQGVNPAEATFVFVTPRRWGGKNDWLSSKTKSRIWHEVRAYDADDLETWLEGAPSVHAWLSLLLGKDPQTVIDLESFWSHWAEATQPPVSPDLILAGRTDAADRLQEWLGAPPSALAICADTQDEALVFVAAAIMRLAPPDREAVLARCVVVQQAAVWRQIAAADQPLVVLPLFAGESAAPMVQGGHHCLIPLGRSDPPPTDSLELPRIRRRDAAAALRSMGLPENQASDLGLVARRSLQSLRRRLAYGASLQVPAWAQPAVGHSLLPALLAGEWDDVQQADQEAIAELAASPYEQVVREFTRWANESDPPVRRIASTWLLVSKEDAWSLLARLVTPIDLQRFRDVALKVLGTPDPALQLPPDQRWAAAVYGKARSHSRRLREGLAETLAIMGARSSSIRIGDGSVGQDHANRLVHLLLQKASQEADGTLWSSLSDIMPHLAEAAPDTFLSYLDEDLGKPKPSLRELFVDSDVQGAVFSNSPHTGLLWALESLAWHPDYLGRAALAMARLARLDPGGALHNRPINSLLAIFLPWRPQTAATIEHRLNVLDMLREREERVTWNLLNQLLQRHSVAVSTYMPKWRDWRPDELQRVTYAEIDEGTRQLLDWILSATNNDADRWREVIRHVTTLPSELRTILIERLLGIDFADMPANAKAVLRDGLRDIIGAQRALTADLERRGARKIGADDVGRLTEAYERLHQEDPIEDYAWLFSNNVHLWEFEGETWREREASINQARNQAVREVFAYGGTNALLAMSNKVESSGQLGSALGRTDLMIGMEAGFLTDSLSVQDSSRARLARAYVAAHFGTQGWPWAECFLGGSAAAWTTDQTAEFLTALPRGARTWKWAGGLGPDIERAYWERFAPYGVRESNEQLTAAEELLRFGRPHAAIELLGHATEELQQEDTSAIVARLLEAAAETPLPDDPFDRNSFVHSAVELLDMLESSMTLTETRLAVLEWAYLPLLHHSDRSPRLLHGELARNPSFFADVVSLVYRAEDEKPGELEPDDQNRAVAGAELLDTWHAVPGVHELGHINSESLSAWIADARQLLADRGRGAIGDEVIGRALRYAPLDSDGAWPVRAVRDVIESIASSDLEAGVEMEIINSRGVVVRAPVEGGHQEQLLVDRYNQWARTVADQWPRTAAMLRRVGDTYLRMANRQDQDAELREDLGY
jgi:hypothetical protein